MLSVASRASLAFAPPAYPKVPFEDCGSSALKPEAAYYKQLNATNCINGYDATPLRTITNATQTIEVYTLVSFSSAAASPTLRPA